MVHGVTIWQYRAFLNIALSSEHSNMTHIVPSIMVNNSGVTHEVYVGLLLQFHYVGLDQLPMPSKITIVSENTINIMMLIHLVMTS